MGGGLTTQTMPLPVPVGTVYLSLFDTCHPSTKFELSTLSILASSIPEIGWVPRGSKTESR